MVGIPFRLAVYGRDRYGVVSIAELSELGVSPSQRRRLIAAGLLTRLFNGVYRLASAPDTFHGRCRAVCLACPQAVITGRAAGRLWGVRRVGPEPKVIEVRVPHSSQSFGEGVLQRRCNVLDPIDVVDRPDGIRVVSPARLPFDLAAELETLDLESVIEQVLDVGWCTLATLWDTDRRLFHPARPGAAAYRRVLASRPSWGAPADSHLEVILLDALETAGVQGLVRQLGITLPNGVTVHPDLAQPELMWAIEIDHVWWHGQREAGARDKWRDRQLTVLGWTTSRVTDGEINTGLDTTVLELVAIARRLAAPSRPAPALPA